MRNLLAVIAILFYSQTGLAQFQGEAEVIHTLGGVATLGWAVSPLTDIDGDGVTDILIGATAASTAEVRSGATGVGIFQFQLANSELGYSVADAGDVNNDGTHDIITGGVTNLGIANVYSGADGSLLWSFPGLELGDRQGSAVAPAGDINNDGHADLMVGAEGYPNGSQNGRAYIYSGADGQVLRTLEAEDSQDRFGGGTALIKDLNNDGVDDHIIGAWAGGPDGEGRVYVYSGADGSELFRLDPDDRGSVFGQFFVADAGDVDNDGTHDVYVGDYNHANGDGRAYVFSGADQQVLYRFEGTNAEGAGPGRSAGDVNNDGHDDLIVGFYTSSVGAPQAGRVTVYSGKDGTELQSWVSDVAGAAVGFDAVGIGDVNGDGKYDYLLSAALVNIVFVMAGNVERPDNFVLNPGLNGSWFNQDTSGQGFFIDVFPGIPLVFLAWFTYDTSQPPMDATAVVGHPGHRWITAQGSFSGKTAILDVTNTSGGIFDDPENTSNSEPGGYGTITLSFEDCTSGMVDYQLTGTTPMLSGSVPIKRIAQDNVALCESLTADP